MLCPSSRPRRSLRLRIAAVLSAVAAVGCSTDDATAPPERFALSEASLAAARSGDKGPRLHSNAAKYRDEGLRPARGASGSVALTARALLGKDGTTTLDLTTGQLDAPPPAPGNLSHVQIKLLRPNGHSAWTENYRSRSNDGASQYTFRGLVRGSRLQIEAKVRDLGLKRTERIGLTETVKLRPDLAATIAAPATARARTLVVVAATVRELNGDVGARADCVLSADGAVVDRATGIWVDAGRAVSCAFTTSFAAAGTYRLSVSLAGVLPGDYDPANNDASTSIRVIDVTDFAYNAFVRDQSYSYAAEYTQYEEDEDGTRAWERVETTSYDGREQSSYITATSPTILAFPLTRLEVSQATNGEVFHAATYDNAKRAWTHSYSSGGITYTYEYFYDYTPAANGAYVHVSVASGTATDATGTVTPWTSIYYLRFAGDVTYRGAAYERSWNPSAEMPGSYHVSNSAGSGRWLPFIDYGSDFAFNVLLNDRGKLYSANPTLVLEPFAETIGGPQPLSCSNSTEDDGTKVRSCFRYLRYDVTGVKGSAFYEP